MRFGVALLLFSTACVPIEGGAVELAWALFDCNGRQCCTDVNPCTAAKVDEIWLRLTPLSLGGDGGTRLDYAFACNLNQAATSFVIQPGRYSITVDARNKDPMLPMATGPAPIEREVRRGEVVELGAVALTVPMSCACRDQTSCQ